MTVIYDEAIKKQRVKYEVKDCYGHKIRREINYSGSIGSLVSCLAVITNQLKKS